MRRNGILFCVGYIDKLTVRVDQSQRTSQILAKNTQIKNPICYTIIICTQGFLTVHN